MIFCPKMKWTRVKLSPNIIHLQFVCKRFLLVVAVWYCVKEMVLISLFFSLPSSPFSHSAENTFPFLCGKTQCWPIYCFCFFWEEELHSIKNISSLLKTGEDAVEALTRNTKVVALNLKLLPLKAVNVAVCN